MLVGRFEIVIFKLSWWGRGIHLSDLMDTFFKLWLCRNAT